MNPKKAYYLKNRIEITSIILIIFLILQGFFYYNKNNNFRLPNFIVDIILSNLFAEGKLIVQDLYLQLNKTILLDQIRMESIDLKYDISEIKIKYQNFFSLNLNNIKILDIKKLNINKSGNKYTFKNISIQRIENKIKFYFEHFNKFSIVKFSGTIVEDKLKYLIKSLNVKENESNYLTSIFDKIVETQSKRIPIDNKKLQILVNCNIDNNITLNIHQTNYTQNDLKYLTGLTGMIKFPIHEPQNIIFSLSIKDQIIYFENSSLNISNLILKRKKSDNHFVNNLYHSFISFQKLILSDKIIGDLPGFNMYVNEDSDTFKTLFISDTKESTVSNELTYNSREKKYKLSGTSRFIPKNFNLFYNDNNQSVRIIDGDELIINLTNNNNFISLIDINTINFSVFDSPPGDFEGKGTLDNNFSFKFLKSKFKMGNSIVEGSYAQEFYPLHYSFNVSGVCDPNDLNNWMGDWWKTIWSDFQFYQDSLPYGNFAIDGIWGQNDKTTLIGSVKTDALTFRNLKLKQTDITVKLDENSTEISTPKIIHNYGIIMGSIKFLRRNDKLSSLTYYLDGNLPINDGTKVFGSVVEDYLNDFNTSDINIISSGTIPLQLNEANKTSVENSSYEINFSAEENGTWNGVYYDTIRGKIISVDNNLTIHLTNIVSEGTGLSIKANFTEAESYSLSLNLKDAPIHKIINSIIDYEISSGKSISTSPHDLNKNLTGSVNLSFNGSGILEDSSSLKGSGKITVNDKNLRQIHLLGTLSESLNILPIPLPIGTLNFNKLSGHFNLENDHIYFDDLSLTSLLSKLSSSGSINFNSGTIDFTSNLNIVGNLFPIIDRIDPLSIISDIKLSGHWENPNWKIQLSEIK